MKLTKKIFLISLIILFDILHNYALANIASIIGIQTFKVDNNLTRIIFNFNTQPKYQTFFIGNPPRFVIDLENAHNISSVNHASLSKTQIANIRFGKHENNSLRVVLDLKKPLHYKQYFANKKLVIELFSSYPKPVNKPVKLIVVPKIKSNLTPSTIASVPLVSRNAVSTAANNIIQNKITNSNIIPKSPVIKKPLSNIKPSELPKIPIKPSEPQKTHVLPQKLDLTPTLAFAGNKNIVPAKSHQIVIVIDPGHGGKDSGAKGLGGTLEKNVVLDVAKFLQTDLNNIPGFKAILTRNGDYFLPLSERLRIASENKANLFISIHADIYKKSYHVNGASIFALSEKGATTEAAKWLAQQENASELGKNNDEKSTALKSVLIDIAHNATIIKSLQIGDVLLKQLNAAIHLHSKEVEQAAFVVLKSPEIPSLLIEVGFLSDPHEELELRDINYDQEFAKALAEGIKNYFANSSYY